MSTGRARSLPSKSKKKEEGNNQEKKKKEKRKEKREKRNEKRRRRATQTSPCAIAHEHFCPKIMFNFSL